MEKLTFNIVINASREKVWEVLLSKETYPKWTSVWSESSRAETDWKKGSKALFLDNENRGMVSEIADAVPAEFLSIRHLGEIKNGVEDTTSEKVKIWSGLLENYTLSTIDGQTQLYIDCDMPASFAAYMSEVWPKALEIVKELAEQPQ